MTFGGLEWGYVVILALKLLIAAPLAIWSVMILKKDWNETYLVKRQNVAIAGILCTFCFIEFVHHPVIILGSGLGILNGNEETYEYAVFYLSWMITFPLLFMSSWLLLARVWLYYFDTQFNDFESNKSWRMAIDPIKESQNWFGQNKYKYGNLSYLLKFIVLISFLQSWILMLFWDIFEWFIIADLWFSLCFILFFIIGVYLSIKLKYNTKNDNLGIRKELIGWIIFIPLCLIIVFVPIYIGIITNNINGSKYRTFVQQCSSNIVLHIALYLTVIFPKQLYFQLRRSIHFGFGKYYSAFEYSATGTATTAATATTTTVTAQAGRTRDLSLTQPSLDITTNMSSVSSMNHKWRYIVSTYDGYEALMKHLEKEFSGTYTNLQVKFIFLLFCLSISPLLQE